jgi:hypothetical protein
MTHRKRYNQPGRGVQVRRPKPQAAARCESCFADGKTIRADLISRGIIVPADAPQS